MVTPPFESPTPPIQVLLIEDCVEDGELIAHYLESGPVPLEVQRATSMAEAWECLDRGGIEVALCDLSLPDSGGFQTFERLARHPSRVPIIILSGLSDEALALRIVEAGAQDYLVKGMADRAAMIRSIRYALKRAEAERALREERNLLRNVIDNLPDSIYVKDAAGKYLLGNRAHAREVGLASPEDLVGRSTEDFFPPEMAQDCLRDDAEVMRSGRSIINRHDVLNDGPSAEKWLSTTKVPLRDDHGQTIGVVGIGRDITARKRSEEELARYTTELRDKNAEMEDDLKLAREGQQAFLPQQFPNFPHDVAPEESALRFVSQYLPAATLSGDFFHVLPISDTEAGVFICDVMGHGVRAALVTAIQRTLVEELQSLARDPGEFLSQMNQALVSILRRTRSPLFASAFYLVADVARGRVRYANAGHPRPLHLSRALGTVQFLDGGGRRPDAALGVFDDLVYRTHETTIEARDLIVLFTDGLYEVENSQGELYDQTLLTAELAIRLQDAPEQIFEEVISEVRAFSANHEFGDDVCLVGMEVRRAVIEPALIGASTENDEY